MSQLLSCYLRFGDWEEATTIALDVLDAALGRRNTSEFDPSIQTITSYLPMPIIPYTVIEDLANQMNVRIEEQPELEEVSTHHYEMFNVLKSFYYPLFRFQCHFYLYVLQFVNSLKARCDDFVIRVIETRQERQMFYNATAAVTP